MFALKTGFGSWLLALICSYRSCVDTKSCVIPPSESGILCFTAADYTFPGHQLQCSCAVWLCTGAVQLLLSFPKNLFLGEARITQWKSELRYLIWKLSGSITWLTEFVERRMELIQIFLSRSCDKLPQPRQLTEKRIYDRASSSRGFCSIVAKWSHGSRSRKLRAHILKCKHKANWRWLESLNIPSPVSVTYFLLQGCTS